MKITTQERKKLGKEWNKKTEGLDLKNPEVEVDWHNESTGKYLSDVVFAANDGIITTFAVVAGVAGAGLEPTIVIILGVANLLADGGMTSQLISQEPYEAQDLEGETRR